MKNSTVLAAAMAMGLAFHAQAKMYTPVFTEDFESTSPFASGWTWKGSAHEQAERTLIDGTTMSQFLHITGTKYERGDYTFNSDCTALTDYRLEFDWFANMGYNAKTCRLYVYAGDDVLFQAADPNAASSNLRKGYLFLGSDNSDTAKAVATFGTAERGKDCINDGNQAYWYHITITANATDGVFLKIASQDSSVGTVYNARISDFANVTKIAFTADSSSYNTYGGIDNIVFAQGSSESFAWTGDVGDNKWSTPGNWTVADVAQTEKYPEIGDFVSNVDADLLAALDVAVKLAADGNAMRFANFATDKTKKSWVAQGADTRWTTLANWVYTQGGFTVYETPERGDTLTFPASLPAGTEVSFSNNVGDDDQNNGYALVVDGNVAFVSTTAAQRSLYSVNSVSGSGVLSLDNIILRTMLYKTLSISADLEVDGSACLYLRGSAAKVTFSGTLSGSGTLKLDADTNGNHSFALTGDMSGFAGTLEIPQVIRSNYAAGCSYSFNGDDSTIDLSGVTVSIADPMTMTLGGTYSEDALKIGALTGAGTINNNTSDAMTLVLGNDETDAESSVVLAVKDGTGAWTVAKTGSNTQGLSDTTVAFNVSVEEGTLALPVGKSLGTVAVSGGALGFAADSAWVEDTPYTLFTYSGWDNPSSAAIALDQSELDVVHSVAYDFATPGTVALTLSEVEFVWNGGTSGYWEDAGNWLIDGVAASSAPGYQNKVTIDAATVYVDISAALTDVTLSNSAKIGLLFTDAALAYTIPSGMAETDFVVAGPYTMEESEGVLTATRVASTFTWAGGASGEWTDAANWTVGGGRTAVVPGTDDDVVIGAEADITFASAGYAKTITLNADATFSGTSIQCPQYSGSGTLSVEGITLTAPTTGHFTIDTPINVVAETSNTFTLETAATSSQSDWRYIYFNAAISGSGAIVLNQRSRQGLAGGRFSGDCSAFAGSISVINCKDSRDASDFSGSNATSSNAVYTVVGRGDAKASMFATANTTYFIGALNGTVYQQSASGSGPAGVVLEIGGRNENCAFGGNLSVYANGKTAIRKVGTGKLTCSASNIGDVEIVSGTYEVTANTQSGNIKFTGDGVFRSTIAKSGGGGDIDYALKLDGSENYPIVFDDGGLERTWATAIKASNKAGFTKLGAGTLTLSAAPKYTGWTTVKAGKLIVPTGTALDVVACADGEIEGATTNNLKFASGYTLTAGEESHVATGAADVANLTVYIANPASAESITIVRAGSVTGTATLAFPEGTSEKDKAKWSLKMKNGTLKASAGSALLIIFR